MPRRSVPGMCRSIHTLHNFEPAATTDEVQAAALQYVRKIAGTTRPSKANQQAFDHAVAAIADGVCRRMSAHDGAACAPHPISITFAP